MKHESGMVKTLSEVQAAEYFPNRKAPLPCNGELTFPFLPRGSFALGAPREAEMVLMRRLDRITVHHSGFPDPFTTAALPATASYLREIYNFHTGKANGQRGWADFGYHFAIDRAGRVWQLRPLHFQGAHVRNHNANNAGIVVLGNFDLQEPVKPQLATLRDFLNWLRQVYALPEQAIQTHTQQADSPTNCPGRLLIQAIASPA